MPRRRPGAAAPSILRLAAYLLLLSATPAYASLQQKPSEVRGSQPDDAAIAEDRATAPLPGGAENNGNLEATRYNQVKENRQDADRTSAIATLALASNAVRAPKPAQEPSRPDAAGLSSLLNARSLQDWEVEDFILLATVDGSLYAVNRTTGAEKWNLMMEKPMVESTYYRENLSSPEDYRPGDDSLWIVEPSRDGEIYRYTYGRGPGAGLQRLGFTVKRLSEQSPWAEEDVVFTADKKTTLYTVDAATGKVTKEFKPGGGSIFQSDDQSCRHVIGLEGGDQDECGSSGSIILGRTEYTVGIQYRDTAEPICSFVYSEWGPNNYDYDLQGQYRTTMDEKYIYPRHDGHIFAFDHTHLSARGEPQRVYKQRLPSPAVRVFDVVKPLDTEESGLERNTQLVVLPQPIAPIESDPYYSADEYRNRVFVNHTESGGWYAMSEETYPTVTGGAQKAHCYSEDWLALSFPSAILSLHQKQEALIGVHFLDADHVGRNSRLTISGPQSQPELGNEVPGTAKSQPSPMTSNFVLKNSKIIQSVSDYNAADAVILAVITILVSLALSASKWTQFFRNIFKAQGVFPKVEQHIGSVPTSPITSRAPDLPHIEPSGESIFPEEFNDGQLTPTPSRPPTQDLPPSPQMLEAKIVPFDNGSEAHVQIVEPTSISISADDDGTETPTPKKKARRGCRGGTKHRKKKPSPLKMDDEFVGANDEAQEEVSETSQDGSSFEEKEVATESEVRVVNETSSSATDATIPVVQIGHLKVHMDNKLGYGSQGTVVYRGTFGGRDVAVKRMLQQFYDIASHEVSLLQESDDHPNVIRYYDKESAGEFLYIALELCPASLQDVIEQPLAYPNLLGKGGLDLPDALKQITAGVRHLHSLKIIHRDIKPQNILLSLPKKLPTALNVLQPPRLLISDFGLCKKLEGDQSSFRATTAHAAGTSGWRAPELLVDEDAETPSGNNSQSSIPSSQTITSAHSASEPQVLDSQTNRRATRAIDIFSLGCVFYYVLTSGSHPFDRDGKYMREANIVKGRYTLGELDRLGDYRREAEDLVASMLSQEPRDRPDAAAVMVHPFFWTPSQRLEFLCHVSDAFEFEPRDPPSPALQVLEAAAARIIPEGGYHAKRDFLRELPPAFKDNLGKQRKYDGGRVLDLLRALRNKKNHYEDMPDNVKRMTGTLPEGYLGFWTRKFPNLLVACRDVVVEVGWTKRDRFKSFFEI